MTRSAVSPEEMPTRYLMQVIEDGTPGAIETLIGELTRTFSLYIDRNYEFLFWADQGEDYYTATNLQDIKVATAANESMGIAYRGYYEWNGSDTSINLTLGFAVSKITLVNTTNPLYYGNSVSVTLGKAYTTISAKDGVLNQAAAYTYTQDITTTIDPDENVATFYVMTKADEKQNITVTVNTTDVATVTATPSPGKYLKLSGNIGGASIVPQESLSITVSLGEWGDIPIKFGPNVLSDYTIASGSLQGSGTPEDPYRITSGADLLYYMSNYANSKIHAILYTDIEINRTNWQPTSLSGTFDGGNHTISGTMTINASNEYAGLFRSVNSGTVRNLIMDVEMTVTGDSNDSYFYTGSIAGNAANSTFENCVNHGDIDASGTRAQVRNSTGGIVGNTLSGKVSGCTNTGKVTGGEGSNVCVGGIVGKATGTELEENVFGQGSPATETGN